MTSPLQCQICKNFLPGAGLKCLAFPEGIPGEIVTGEFDHARPFGGEALEIIDGPILFDPIEGSDPEG